MFTLAVEPVYVNSVKEPLAVNNEDENIGKLPKSVCIPP